MRKLIVSLIAMSLLVLPAAATSIRTQSMNIGADDVEDIGNIVTFPQLIGVYQNKVLYSNVVATDVSSTVLLCELASYTVGVAISDNQGSFNGGFIGAELDTLWVDAYASGFTALYPDETASLLFAGAVGPGTLGVNLSYAKSSNTDNQVISVVDPVSTNPLDKEQSASYLGLVVGLGMEEVGPLARLDVSVGIGLPNHEYTKSDPLISTTDPLGAPDVTEFTKDGGMDMEIQVQGIKEQSDETSLRLQGYYQSSSYDQLAAQKADANNDDDYTDVGDTHKEKLIASSKSVIGVGCVVNRSVNDAGLLVAGLKLAMVSTKVERSEKVLADGDADGDLELEQVVNAVGFELNEDSDMIATIEIAVEDQVREGWTGRLGASKDINLTNGNDETDDTYGLVDSAWATSGSTVNEKGVTGSGDVTLKMGLGVALGNFTVNCDVSADVLLSGPYFVSGTTGAFASALDVIYSF